MAAHLDRERLLPALRSALPRQRRTVVIFAGSQGNILQALFGDGAGAPSIGSPSRSNSQTCPTVRGSTNGEVPDGGQGADADRRRDPGCDLPYVTDPSRG
jgi:hypothetical protein